MDFLRKKIRNYKYTQKGNKDTVQCSDDGSSEDTAQVAPQRSVNALTKEGIQSINSLNGKACNEALNRKKSAKGKQKNQPSAEEIKEGLHFLKNAVATEENPETIETQLIVTAAHRREMVKVNKLDFLEHFPILFTNPEFVSGLLIYF